MRKRKQNLKTSMLEDTMSEELWNQSSRVMWGKLGYTLLDRLRDQLWMQLMYHLKGRLWDQLEEYLDDYKQT